jgi:hypothetical protein
MSPCRSDHIFTVVDRPRSRLGRHGVRRVVSEDSECLYPMDPPVSTSPIHREGAPAQRSEPVLGQVLAVGHRTHDGREGTELLLLGAEEWGCFEEGDDPVQEIIAAPHYVHKCRVRCATMVVDDPAATKTLLNQVDDLSPFTILTDAEFRNELPTDPRARIPLNGNMERTFPVDVARNIGIQPFLLIDRT